MKKEKNELIGKFDVKNFPKIRRVIEDTVDYGKKMHHMKALIEIDITEGKRKIQEIKNHTKKDFSLTGWIIYCVAKMIQEFPEIHAIKKKNKVIIFQDVDVAVMVNRNIEGNEFPVVNVIRKANEKTVKTINEEIQNAKKITAKEYLSNTNTKAVKFLVSLPKFFRRNIFCRKVLRDPFYQK